MKKHRIKIDGDIGKSDCGITFSKTKQGMTGTEKTEIVISSIQSLSTIIDGIKDLSKEKELTKRKKLEFETDIKKLDNELEEILSKERIQLTKIHSEFELNYKQLENESEKNKLQAKIIEKMLDMIERLNNRVDDYERKFGIAHETVIALDNKLHELSMNLTSQLQLQS